MVLLRRYFDSSEASNNREKMMQFLEALRLVELPLLLYSLDKKLSWRCSLILYCQSHLVVRFARQIWINTPDK